MARGVRNLTPQQERELYAARKLRDALSTKGLARKWGISERAVLQAIERQRTLEREQRVGANRRMGLRAALV
jgi:L-cysteine desulfidase